MKSRIFLSIILLMICQPLLAKINVSVDRDPIVVDESFQLIFESDEQINAQPDFNDLKQSLTIINASNRSSTQIVNGNIIYKQQWVLTAVANRAGLLEIPSIKFDKTYSPAVKLRVTKPSANAKQISDDVYLETSLSNDTPFVQAQVVLTIKLYRAIFTSNSTLSEPTISGGQVVLEKLGDDNSYEQQNQGKVYNVIERRYVIFPQNSGKLTIEPIVFQGQTGNTGFFGRDPFGPPAKTIVKRSESLSLDVKPIPTSFTGTTWLPAEDITIKETWSVSPDKLKAGEAVTRIIIMEAKGLAASQLPPAVSELPDSFKQYPDQPEFEENRVNNMVVGVRREKIAVIPTQDGTYLLPAIKLPWWNTKTDQPEIAELPERQIIVNPVANSTKDKNVIDQGDLIKAVPDSGLSTIPVNLAEDKQHSFWQWLALVIFIVWLLTLFAWYRASKISKPESKEKKKKSIKKYKQAVIQAAKQNDAKATQQALLNWGRVNWPLETIINLHQLKTKLTPQLKSELDSIDACLYGINVNQWQGEQFIKLFEAQNFQAVKKETGEQTLEPLYKS